MRILSFDIEEWFHILDNESTKSIFEWQNYESRIHNNVDRILTILNKSNRSATFFILGWIAEKYPDVVKKIYSCGHEIGSHSDMHQLAYLQSKNQFKNDIASSIHRLEDLTGQKIEFFRAPGFSITEKNVWAFDILYNLGIKIDCSVFPTIRAHGGMPTIEFSKPSIIKSNGVCIKEFPINTYNIFGRKIVFSGGGYFRLLPYPLIKIMTDKSDYIMSYFHPRDFDPDQPKIKELSFLRTFKSYVGLSKTETKLLKWLFDYEFVNISEADNSIDWANAKVMEL